MKKVLQLVSRIKDDLTKIEAYIEGRTEAADYLDNSKKDVAFNLHFEKDWIVLEDNYDVDRVIDKIEEMGLSKLGQVERKEEPNLPKLKEGSIYKRKDGRWMGRYYDNGVRRFVYAYTKKDIIAALNKAVIARDKRESDLLVSKSITLNKWIKEWMDLYKSDLKKSTLSDYESNIVKKVRAHQIGRKQVSRITSIDLERFFKSINAPAAKARTFRQLKSCFSSLVKNRIIKDDPFDMVRNISEPKTKAIAPSRSDLNRFFLYLKDAYFEIYLFAKFISLTGLRKGEALALRWDDIQSDHIVINKAYEAKAKKVQSTKTKTSNRTIPLFADLLPLFPLMKQLSDGVEVFSFIYKTSVGTRFRHHRNKFGIKNLTIHSLRHFFATECLEAGVDRKVVQVWLGHSNYKTTSDIYSHVNNSFEKSQVELLSKFRSE